MGKKFLTPPAIIIACLLLIMVTVLLVLVTPSLPATHQFIATGKPQIFLWEDGDVVKAEVFFGWAAGEYLDFAYSSSGTPREVVVPPLEPYVFSQKYMLWLPDPEGVMPSIKDIVSVEAHKTVERLDFQVEITLTYKGQAQFVERFFSRITAPTPDYLVSILDRCNCGDLRLNKKRRFVSILL